MAKIIDFHTRTVSAAAHHAAHFTDDVHIDQAEQDLADAKAEGAEAAYSCPDCYGEVELDGDCADCIDMQCGWVGLEEDAQVGGA